VIHGGIFTSHNQKLILSPVLKTSSIAERMRGLLWHTPLNDDEGLLIQPCSSIHTFGMHYEIDAVFLSKDLTIKNIFNRVKPYRFVMSFGAAMVLEMLAGNAAKLELVKNMKLQWEPDK
jgi:uncharacterized membrane protein (UPF0127 family)